jgi:hypothetical protein
MKPQLTMQTALQWLSHQIEYNRIIIPKEFDILLDKAIEMEKNQILLAWENGSLPYFDKEYNCSIDYFQETYNN